MQKPGWKDECVRSSMQAIGLLDETSMPYITGIWRETMIERRDRIIREGEGKLEEVKQIVKKLSTSSKNDEMIHNLKRHFACENALMTNPWVED